MAYHWLSLELSYWTYYGSMSSRWLPWWLSGKEPACQYRRYGFSPQKIPWRRKWLHSSILAWRIPRTVGPGGLLSMGVTTSQTRPSYWACTHTPWVLAIIHSSNQWTEYLQYRSVIHNFIMHQNHLESLLKHWWHHFQSFRFSSSRVRVKQFSGPRKCWSGECTLITISVYEKQRWLVETSKYFFLYLQSSYMVT